MTPQLNRSSLPYRLPERPRPGDWQVPPPFPPREPQDHVAILAQGVVAAGIPAALGSLMGNFGVLASAAGAAYIGSQLEPHQGAVKGAALGLLAGALGAGMGPSGVLLASAVGSLLFLGIKSQS